MPDPQRAARSRNRAYARGLARAFGGAILFAFPLLMTMEMWSLGFYISPVRLAVFLIVTLALLVGLAHFTGFEETSRLLDDVLDAFSAFAVGVVASAFMLVLFGILAPGMPWGEVTGKIAIQAIPASIGAAVARKQLGVSEDNERKEARAGYWSQLFLMFAGALFLAFNVAPTDEMLIIAFKMSPWHGLALAALSIAALHAFVYNIGFAGQEAPPENATVARVFLHYSIAGYGIALIVSLYVLWTFGRIDGLELTSVVEMATVLGFPSALGAAIARLIV